MAPPKELHQGQWVIGACLALITLATFLLSVQMIECTTVVHRKPPFNGSIFGKRSVPMGQQQQHQTLSNLINGGQQQVAGSSLPATYEDMILSTVDNYLISQAAATNFDYASETMAFCHLIQNKCRQVFNMGVGSDLALAKEDNNDLGVN